MELNNRDKQEIIILILLHGQPIPPDHVCVMLTTAKNNHPAPLVLGDPSENATLFPGQFYAFPKKSLVIARKQLNSPLINLEPYSTVNYF